MNTSEVETGRAWDRASRALDGALVRQIEAAEKEQEAVEAYIAAKAAARLGP